MATYEQNTALISVYDKDGVEEFAAGLEEMGWSILASGGTCQYLREHGVDAQDVAELVGGEAILGHRVVTLSREVHAGLLAQYIEQDLQELEELEIPRIDLVYVDTYPLQEKIRSGAELDEVLDTVDIGGPTMLMAGLKGKRIVLSDSGFACEMLSLLKELDPDMPLDEEAWIRFAAEVAFFVVEYYGKLATYLRWQEAKQMLSDS